MGNEMERDLLFEQRMHPPMSSVRKGSFRSSLHTKRDWVTKEIVELKIFYDSWRGT